jgi:hypothetical protein
MYKDQKWRMASKKAAVEGVKPIAYANEGTRSGASK